MVDTTGKVLATKNVIPLKPWVVYESKKVSGRYFFFNQITKQAAWSIDPALVPTKVAYEPIRPSCLPAVQTQRVVNELMSGRGLNSSLDSSAPLALPPLQRALQSASAAASEVVNIAHSSLRVVEGLGQGGYGVVVEVEDTVSGKRYAMKVITKDKLTCRRENDLLRLELKIMKNMKPSRFVQRCHDVFATPRTLFIVLDLYLGGDIFYHIMERMQNFDQTCFQEHEICVIMAELTLALEHVHKEGYIHRDVKAENVMLDSSGHVKLIDFGLAFEIIDEEMQEMPMRPSGTLVYMAPELIVRQTGGRHTDWWAVGVLAFEMLAGSSPWSSQTDKRLIEHEIQNREVNFPPHLNASPGMCEFIASLLEKDHTERLGSRFDADVKAASFFDTIDWSATALGESPHAFEVKARCVVPEEGADAMAQYMDRLQRNHRERPSGPAASPWGVGVRAVEAFPPIASMAVEPTELLN